MRKVLIATHGKFAEGIRTSLDIIIGKNDDIEVINAYVDDQVFEDQLKHYLESVMDDDILIVMTDLFGGSVNQCVMRHVDVNKSFVITGVNLAIMLEVLLMPVDNLSRESIQNAILTSREQLMLVQFDDDDSDDFDALI